MSRKQRPEEVPLAEFMPSFREPEPLAANEAPQCAVCGEVKPLRLDRRNQFLVSQECFEKQPEPEQVTETIWRPQRDGGEYAPVTLLAVELRERLKVPKSRFEDDTYAYRAWESRECTVIVSRYPRG